MKKYLFALLVCVTISSTGNAAYNTSPTLDNATGILKTTNGGTGTNKSMSENSFWVMGDSRAAAVFISTAPREGSLSELNWANSLLGHPFNVLGSSAVSSSRTDQLSSQIGAAISSNAKNIYLRSGVNDISANYPSASTSGATACANLKTYTTQLINSGRRVILAEEIGREGFTVSQLGQLHILRSCTEEYVRQNPKNLILVDYATVVNNPTNSSKTSLVFKTGYVPDGTHNARLGAFYMGQYLSDVLKTVLPVVPSPSGLTAAYQDPSNIPYGVTQIISNPTFLATSSISATGVTGTGPTGWTFEKSGAGTSATVTMQTNTDTFGGAAGVGNEVVIQLTCGASGDSLLMTNTPNIANWALTDTFIGTGAYAVAAGATNVSVPSLINWIFTDPLLGVFSDAMYNGDEGEAAKYPAPSIAYSGRLVVPAASPHPDSTAKSYMYFGYRLMCTGAGSGTVTLRPVGLWKI